MGEISGTFAYNELSRSFDPDRLYLSAILQMLASCPASYIFMVWISSNAYLFVKRKAPQITPKNYWFAQ